MKLVSRLFLLVLVLSAIVFHAREAKSNGFSGTTITDPRWTCTNCGTSSFTLTNGELVFTPQNAISDQWRLVTQVAPSAPWTYVVASNYLPTLNNFTQYCGMVVYDGTKLEHLGLLFGNGVPNWSLRVTRWTNVTTFSATQFQSISGAAAVTGTWIYLKIQNDATNLNFFYSYDGVTYFQVYSETITAFLANANNIGFGCDVPSTSANPIFVMDYFRRTQ